MSVLAKCLNHYETDWHPYTYYACTCSMDRACYNHRLAWNMPPTQVIPENLPNGAINDLPLHIEQGLAYGKHCYREPKPPFHWNHRYRSTVYTLVIMLTIRTDSDKAALLNAMDGHILQTGCLYGKHSEKAQSITQEKRDAIWK